MEVALFAIYLAFGYWACGKTIYANSIRIGAASDLFLRRIILGALLGIIIIPIAIIRTILHI